VRRNFGFRRGGALTSSFRDLCYRTVICDTYNSAGVPSGNVTLYESVKKFNSVFHAWALNKSYVYSISNFHFGLLALWRWQRYCGHPSLSPLCDTRYTSVTKRYIHSLHTYGHTSTYIHSLRPQLRKIDARLVGRLALIKWDAIEIFFFFFFFFGSS